ncbi:MAG: PHP domain-containing protein [Clostridia bacterium]|nr:PHP domain-containing protein [Clostridia bacterium]
MSKRSIHVDLHMHSCLSPCGDAEMTPANIVGLASLSGLDAIALTDHNISLNVGAAMRAGEAYGVTVVPGMELETTEEVHVVCLFPDLETLTSFQQTVSDSYTQIDNKPEIFGEEIIMDEEDNILGYYPHLLLTPTGISIDDVIPMVSEMGGIAYPAHVDRDSYSVLSNLGAMPYGYPYGFAEISYECDIDALYEKFPFMKDYTLIHASDAHYPAFIADPGALLEVEELSPRGIIEALKTLQRGLIL